MENGVSSARTRRQGSWQQRIIEEEQERKRLWLDPRCTLVRRDTTRRPGEAPFSQSSKCLLPKPKPRRRTAGSPTGGDGNGGKKPMSDAPRPPVPAMSSAVVGSPAKEKPVVIELETTSSRVELVRSFDQSVTIQTQTNPMGGPTGSGAGGTGSGGDWGPTTAAEEACSCVNASFPIYLELPEALRAGNSTGTDDQQQLPEPIIAKPRRKRSHYTDPCGYHRGPEAMKQLRSRSCGSTRSTQGRSPARSMMLMNETTTTTGANTPAERIVEIIRETTQYVAAKQDQQAVGVGPALSAQMDEVSERETSVGGMANARSMLGLRSPSKRSPSPSQV